MSEALLQIDSDSFGRHFPGEPFTVGHRLSGHPLFELPRLIELFQVLPPECVEYNAGNLEVNQDPGKTPGTGLSVEETIRRIEQCNSWLVLKYVEQDVAYRDLLFGCLGEIERRSESKLGEMDQREGFIFVSSPNAVTPYHMDPEHNFLLQVRGDKTVHIFDGRDRALVSEGELERFYEGKSHRNMEFREEFQTKARSFKLNPGMGLYFPIADPHWVKVSDNVSISFSITFRSPVSARQARLYQANAALRRLGIPPAPIGKSSWRDGMKDIAFRAARRSRGLLGRSETQRRAY